MRGIKKRGGYAIAGSVGIQVMYPVIQIINLKEVSHVAIRSTQENWERAKRLIAEHAQVLSAFRLRTVTMGFNLLDSIDSNIATMTNTVTQRLADELPIFNQAITQTLEELSVVVGTDPESLLQTRRT